MWTGEATSLKGLIDEGAHALWVQGAWQQQQQHEGFILLLLNCRPAGPLLQTATCGGLGSQGHGGGAAAGRAASRSAAAAGVLGLWRECILG